ncbi:hypothetical protein Tco_1483325, partial [Tanacetum coccineum]
VERHIVGNRILHTHETGVCEVARMVEMSVCEAARIVARKFTMGIGYDRMVALGMWFHRMVALGIGYNSGNCDGTVNLNSRKMVGYLLEIVDQLDYVCLQAARGQMIFCIDHVCGPLYCIYYNVYLLSPHPEIVYGLYFWDDRVVGYPFEEE